MKGTKKSHGLLFQPNAQFARNVCETVQCCECLKPGVLYSRRKLKHQEEVCLQGLLCDVMYSCGRDLVCADSSPIAWRPSPPCIPSRKFDLLYPNRNSLLFFSSFENVCVHCGAPEELVKGEESVDIMPTCECCFQRFSAAKCKQVLPAKSPDLTFYHFLWCLCCQNTKNKFE